MGKLITELEQKTAQIQQGGDEVARKRHLSRNKLLPRDRINRLLDSG